MEFLAPEAEIPPPTLTVPYRAETRLKLHATLTCAFRQPERMADLAVLEHVNTLAATTVFYHSAHAQRVHPESRLPFRLSPEPFRLPDELRENLPAYGQALASFYRQADALVRSLPKDHRWAQYLGHHKPEWMDDAEGNHVFIRPDFVLTEDGPVVTELETSPFGLALSYFLNDAYRLAGKDTLSDGEELLNRLVSLAPFVFGFTAHTERYEGQLRYLANVLRERGADVRAAPIHEVGQDETIYRCFYLHEAALDPSLLRHRMIPPMKPRMEEKALLGMAWDDEFTFEGQDTLRHIIPPTWVLDEQHCPFGRWQDLATMSRSQRQFVLKVSGFSPSGSWARGVTFLDKLSRERCEQIINAALADRDTLYVIQEFRKGAIFNQDYLDFHDPAVKAMRGRVRFTPYFAVEDGQLLTAKATLCADTDYVHASVDSINIPVL